MCILALFKFFFFLNITDGYMNLSEGFSKISCFSNPLRTIGDHELGKSFLQLPFSSLQKHIII